MSHVIHLQKNYIAFSISATNELLALIAVVVTIPL